jgi:hypothetical protein
MFFRATRNAALPGSTGGTDHPSGEEGASIKIGLDDQHHALTKDRPP